MSYIVDHSFGGYVKALLIQTGGEEYYQEMDTINHEEMLLIGDRLLNMLITRELLSKHSPETTSRLLGDAVSNKHYRKIVNTLFPTVHNGVVKKPEDILEMAVGLVAWTATDRMVMWEPAVKIARLVVEQFTPVLDPKLDESFTKMLQVRKEEVMKKEVQYNHKGAFLEATIHLNPVCSMELNKTGPDHTPEFHASVIADLHNRILTADGFGVTKKDAEQRAYRSLLEQFLPH
jgi:dsRNA-specific ribonuclease